MATDFYTLEPVSQPWREAFKFAPGDGYQIVTTRIITIGDGTTIPAGTRGGYIARPDCYQPSPWSPAWVDIASSVDDQSMVKDHAVVRMSTLIGSDVTHDARVFDSTLIDSFLDCDARATHCELTECEVTDGAVLFEQTERGLWTDSYTCRQDGITWKVQAAA